MHEAAEPRDSGDFTVAEVKEEQLGARERLLREREDGGAVLGLVELYRPHEFAVVRCGCD